MLNTTKNFFLRYLMPFIILLGVPFCLFFLLAFLFLSEISTYVKVFGFLVLFVGALWLVVSSFVRENKIGNVINSILFVCFFSFFSIVLLQGMRRHSTFLFHRFLDIVYVTKTLLKEEQRDKRLSSKAERFFIYCKLLLHDLFYHDKNKQVSMNVFGFDWSYPANGHESLIFKELFIDKAYGVCLENKNPTIIDCGSYVGLSVLFFKMSYPDAEVIGFEAHPKTFKFLSQNIENNKLSNVQLFNKAVYNVEGKLRFTVEGSGQSTLLVRENQNFIQVDSVLLSNYINKPVDLLKMDIEGAEVEVIEELSDKNKLKFIKNIVMEFHHGRDMKQFGRTVDILEKSGFVCRLNRLDIYDAIMHAYRKKA